jgi:hypothetical protein
LSALILLIDLLPVSFFADGFLFMLAPPGDVLDREAVLIFVV